MNRYMLLAALSAVFFYSASQVSAEEPAKSFEQTEAVMFTPPSGWRMADAEALPPSVKIMVVGQGTHELPPSVSLGTENYKGTLKQYLKRVKEINMSKGNEWKDLGTIHTEAGDASLSQVDTKTEWGEVRMMHVMLNKEGTIYIMTASSLKEEFSRYYKDFFNSLRSLRFNQLTHATPKQTN